VFQFCETSYYYFSHSSILILKPFKKYNKIEFLFSSNLNESLNVFLFEIIKLNKNALAFDFLRVVSKHLPLKQKMNR